MNDPFEPEMFYHIYNHANGNENLFRCKDNYDYFLKKYSEYIEPIADTLCYCLMPNHFHLMVKIRPEEKIKQRIIKNLNIHKIQLQYFQGFRSLDSFISKTFSNFFNGYTKAYNEMYHRKGSLFIPRFKRKQISSNEYLTKIIHYIHYNPVHHNFCNSIEDWPFSSYKTIISDKPTKINRYMVLQWFGSKEDFVAFHQWAPELNIEEKG